jgi:hypothetical protein
MFAAKPKAPRKYCVFNVIRGNSDKPLFRNLRTQSQNLDSGPVGDYPGLGDIRVFLWSVAFARLPSLDPLTGLNIGSNAKNRVRLYAHAVCNRLTVRSAS